MPFLKVDKGLADEADGVQVMKPMPGLDELLERAIGEGRVRHEDALGHQAREPGRRRRRSSTSSSRSAARSSAHGLVPIIEPEVDIHSRREGEAEALLKAAILAAARSALTDGQSVMLKLTLPDTDGFYRDLVEHPKVLRVVAPVGRLLPRRSQRAARTQPRG